MAEILRVKLNWTGFSGAPGLSVFHFGIFDGTLPTSANASTAISRVDAFAESLKQFTARGVSLSVDPEVLRINVPDGKLIGSFMGAPAAAHVSTSGAGTLYAGPVGGVVDWKTATIRVRKRSRRLQGRTFLVPLNSSVFSDTGTMNSTNLGTISTAAAALYASGTGTDLVVYGRPSGKGATDGVAGAVTGHKVPTKAAVMRSRRD